MLILDQLNSRDKRLRALAMLMLGALLALVLRLWWLQVFNAPEFRSQQERQSVRTVRIAPVRGMIRDRHGVVLADNLPSFNVCVYLEELQGEIGRLYRHWLARARAELEAAAAKHENVLGRKLTREERARYRLSTELRDTLRMRARVTVVSNLVARLSTLTGVPIQFDQRRFERHYLSARPLPYPVLVGADPAVVARLLENGQELPGVDLDLQPLRYYPLGSVCAHLLGHLRRDYESVEGEDAFFNYPLPVYRGAIGIEAGLDRELRGRSGVKSVLINSVGYRQVERVIEEAIPGQTVVLTVDVAIQQLAEQALGRLGRTVRGAVVVLDPQTGDVLALVSSPGYDPNVFVRGMSHQEWERLSDPQLRPLINRATQVAYAPGSVFKIVTALALLEAGVDPAETVYNPPAPGNPRRGHIRIGRRIIHDTAPPGEYDFQRGFLKSSNTYFITNGLRAGIQNIIRMARQLRFGEPTGIPTRQEVAGVLPGPERLSANWFDGDTANVCIGQGPVAVTPLQVAVMTAAIANGGKVLRPRLVRRIEPGPGTELVDSNTASDPNSAPEIRGILSVRPSTLEVIRRAMVADVEDPESTAYAAFHPGGRYALSRFRVGGKTGTAEVTDEHGRVVDHITWFTSFAPAEAPRYVVVVMVESGGSGGGTCAPVAREIYAGLERLEAERAAALEHSAGHS